MSLTKVQTVCLKKLNKNNVLMCHAMYLLSAILSNFSKNMLKLTALLPWSLSNDTLYTVYPKHDTTVELKRMSNINLMLCLTENT